MELANIKYEVVLTKYKQFEVDRNTLTAENATLKKAMQTMDLQIKQLQKESNDVRQYTRRDCLEIQGTLITKMKIQIQL